MTRCPRCGKKPVTANKRKLLRGHYNITNRYRKYPNLQWAQVNGPYGPGGTRASKRMMICTSCIKTQAKNA